MTEIKPENDMSETAKENILFSPEPANELEKLFKSKTAEYLFLFCNYNPIGWTDSLGFNYASAVANRYRLLKDTGGFIMDLLRNYVPGEDLKKFWDKYLSVTAGMRSVLSHNNSPDNCSLHANRLKQFSLFNMIPGEDQLNLKEEDFEALLDDMLKDAEKFRTIAEKAIYNIPEGDRATVTKNAVARIISFYGLSTNRDIITGQMMSLLSHRPEFQYKKKKPDARDAAMIFRHHMKRRDSDARRLKNPFDCQTEYMNKFFKDDLNDFLAGYIELPKATLLPNDLIQEFVNDLIYPVTKGMTVKLSLGDAAYTKVSDSHGDFQTQALIGNLLLNVTVRVSDTDPEYIDSLISSEDGVTCRALENVYIGDICADCHSCDPGDICADCDICKKGPEIIFTAV